MTSRAGWYGKLALVAALALTVTGAAAQLKPWPDQQPQPPQSQTRAWPGESQASPAPQAAAVQPPPMTAAPPPPMMGGGFGAPPPSSAQGNNPCIAEFTNMRGDVEKAGKVAKAVNDKHGSREEFCKAFTNLHAAQAKWVNYAQKNAKNCGIPPDIIKQLKLGETNLNKMRTNVCNGGGTAGPAAAPSLAEALGTATLPARDSNEVAKKRGGTLDTLTGESIR
ncbi:MAG: hypothetical protein ACXWKC_06650 [Xanthobacteraceae bacterium]